MADFKNNVHDESVSGHKLMDAQAEGELNKAVEIAKNLLNSNMRIAEVARMTGLNREQIKAISLDTTATD